MREHSNLKVFAHTPHPPTPTSFQGRLLRRINLLPLISNMNLCQRGGEDRYEVSVYL